MKRAATDRDWTGLAPSRCLRSASIRNTTALHAGRADSTWAAECDHPVLVQHRVTAADALSARRVPGLRLFPARRSSRSQRRCPPEQKVLAAETSLRVLPRSCGGL